MPTEPQSQSLSRIHVLIRLSVVAVFLAVGACAALAATASAETSLLSCEGTVEVTYSPGLTNTPQMVEATRHYDYSLCINALHPLEGRIGTINSPIHIELACEDLLESGASDKAESTITWKPG